MNKKSVVFALILLLSISMVPFFDVWMRAAADPATVGTSTTSYAVSYGFQRKGFYAADLFWAFYCNGSFAGWEFSNDGTTWTGAFTNIGACLSGSKVSVRFDSTYVHYARHDNYDLFYRRGVPENDGTITWSAVEQLVYDGSSNDEYESPCISVDTDGYAWIGVNYDTGFPNGRPFVFKNANNDGTWVEDFVYELNAVNDVNGWNVCPVPLTDSKVYVIYCRDGQLPLGQPWDAGWGAEENDLADYSIEKGMLFSAGALGDNVHFVYLRDITFQIRHNERVWGVGWNATDVLVQDAVGSSCGPALSVNPSTGDLYCFWTSTTTDHVYYKKWDAGWGDLVDWIDESTDEITSDWYISSYYMDYGSYIGLLYTTKTASPYNIKFASLIVDPATVATSTTYYAVTNGFQRKNFYDESLFWTFYSDGTNAGWETSANGVDWSGDFTSIGAIKFGRGERFSVWFDGTYIHYARDNNYDLFYRRGTPENDGTISWSAVEQTVYDGSDGDEHYYPYVSVDTNGYAWIGTRYKEDSTYSPYALKNANTDGTWALDFAYELSAVSTFWITSIIPLTGGKVFAIYSADPQTVKGRRWTGAAWGDEKSTVSDPLNPNAFSAVAQGDDVHLVFCRQNVDIIYVNYTYVLDAWSDETIVQTDIEYQSPVLSIDTFTDDLYCFWSRKSTNHVYYKQYTDGEWDDTATDWIDETTDGIKTDELISSFYKDYGNYIGVSYVTKLASPYNVRFAFLAIPAYPVNDACDSTSKFIEDTYGWVNVTISDPQGVANLATVDIQVNTTGDAETFTLRWTQSSGIFSEVSDADNICTLDADTSVRVNIDADTDRICFYFKITGGTLGYCDVKATSIDDEAHQDVDTFSNEFNYRFSWIAELDITNLAVDDWVFEGRTRYEFQISYYNDTLESIDQFGIRFTDSISQNHTIWYDQDANTLTVTSFEDGISGWLHSLTEGENNATAIFHIMFNTPIPDTYNVQVEIRVVAGADSGWITPSGDTFNIYNLGGLSTMTSSGSAGRIPGGDVFEMYASGYGSVHILPLENFDVNDVPTTPGVQILGLQISPAGDEHSLINDLVNWKIWTTERTEDRAVFPTNRLPDTGEAGEVTYVSFPFGLLIKSDITLSTSLVAEKEFFRTIETADDEIVIVEFWATVSNDTDVTGQILITDDGYVDDLIRNVTTDTLRIVDFKFYGDGNIRLMDGASSIYPATYSGMVWANYTFVMNLTAQTYDFYVNEVLEIPGVDFCDTVSSIGHISFLDTLDTLDPAEAVEFYVDDLVATTDADVEPGGTAKSTMLFNQLQHWSMDFDFYVEKGQTYAQGPTATQRTAKDDYSNYGYIELGWDVLLGGTWINDYLVARINITDGLISGKNDWVQFNVSWEQQGEYVKHDLLYGLFEGYGIFSGESKDTSGFHWDLWFNRANASTVVGARVNTEYFGMSDKSPWWAIWGSRWTPMRTEVSESTMFVDLEDAEGTVHSVKDVGLVRSWVKVHRTDEGGFYYKVVNLAGLDFMVAPTTMSGIDAPPIRETMIPDVPSGFLGSFLGAIFTSALKRLANTLAGFGLAFFSLTIAFVDIVFAALGYPALVSTIFEWMASLFASVPALVGYGLTLIGQIFRLITVSASDTLGQLTTIITIWINMYGIAKDFLSGVFTPGINLWNDLGVNSFIQIGAVLYPLWLLMMASDKGTQAVIDHLSGVLSIGSFFLNFILNVTEFFVGLLRGLIGAIRG